ncbi:MAG: hypothetical protein AB4290_15165 [Spirulina sp.]
MREFGDFEKWVDALLDDRDEEYYRAIFDVHYTIDSLLRDQKRFSFYYTIDRRDGAEGTEYHFVDERNDSTLIVKGKPGLRELDRYLTERFNVGANNNENWYAWNQRAHEAYRDDRYWEER